MPCHAAYLSAVSHRRVIVVGSGFSGVAMGARLLDAGIRDFLVLEKGSEVGGTWRDNRYPGCACDVPSPLYSLSFAPKADWSRAYAPSAEIWQYLRDCVDRLGLGPHLALDADVTGATWEGDRWRVRVADGREWTSDALVLGVGGLHMPRRPDLPGLGTFGGPVMHTADWPDDDGLDGLRVGVVGTGASAVQLVPELAARVSQLVVFQRTPAWVLPRGDVPVSRWRQRANARIPLVQKASRARTYVRNELNVLGFGRNARLREWVGRRSLEHLASAVSDPVVRAAHAAAGGGNAGLLDSHGTTPNECL